MSSLATLSTVNPIFGQVSKRPEVIECPGCKFKFFREVRAAKYLANQVLVLGQSVPTDPTGYQFILLQCINCNGLVEPAVQYDVREYASTDYTELIEALKKNTKPAP